MRRKSRIRPQVEQLENRLAPAKLLSATQIAYTDVDGDHVTVTLSKPLLTAMNANNIFQFNNASVDGSQSEPQQLQEVNLTSLGASAMGLGLTVSAVRATSFAGVVGDGFANVGYINATGIDLGKVIVAGDLGRIDAGVAGTGTKPPSGLASLTVQSMGRYGTTTQASGGDLTTNIVSKLGTFIVKSDIAGASINVSGAIGAINVGGSLGPGLNPTNGSGSILSDGDMETVVIKGDLQCGPDFGGYGRVGVVSSQGKIDSITVGGSLLANGIGLGDLNAEIAGVAGIGKVSIGGSIYGGDGQDNGEVTSSGNIGSIKIGGALVGGSANLSGVIDNAGNIGSIAIGGSIFGSHPEAGIISSDGSIASISIGGSLDGTGSSGNTPQTAALYAGTNLGTVTIGGSIIGGNGNSSGAIECPGGSISSVTIGGSLVGGGGVQSGWIFAKGIGAVSVGRDIIGGGNTDAGEIQSLGTLGNVTVGGSLVGGAGSTSGSILSNTNGQGTGGIGKLKIGGDIRGGAGDNSGYIFADGNGSAPQSTVIITSIAVGGSVIGGSGTTSGAIRNSDGSFGPITIGGDIRGGSNSQSGQIFAILGSLGKVTLGGSLVAGQGDSSGIITANNNLDLITVKGDVRGGMIFSGGGGTSAGVSVGGTVNNGQIFADKGLGPITIGGDLDGTSTISSNDGKIASLSIGGSVITATEGTEAIQAGTTLGPVKVGGSLIGGVVSGAIVISARGLSPNLPANATADLAIASITVGGRVQNADILAGYDTSGAAVNGDASIGPVKIGGDWDYSNLVAGVSKGMDGVFSADGAVIPGGFSNLIAEIASILIGGQVFAPPGNGNTQYFFEAQEIGSLSVGGSTIPLQAGKSNDQDLSIGASNNFILWER